MIDLVYLDESGFAPTLPTAYTWARPKVRPPVWDEPPQGRRLNVLGALAPCGPTPSLAWTATTGKLDSAAFLDFLWREGAGRPAPPAELPPGYRRAKRCVAVLDNYSVHRSQQVNDVRPALEAAGVELVYLPAYSPDLNRIEPVWRQVKYHAMPVRSYRTVEELHAAVDDALTRHAASLHDATTELAQAA